ncbi:hypothetical protein F5146DRAFT_999188 [Armillaria mellea]|nr:hypothetical protein F5146DRAFT_999188 [Armillaria mellea]
MLKQVIINSSNIIMIFFCYIRKFWPVTPSLHKRLVHHLEHALRLERLALKNHSGGGIPDNNHPEMIMRVHDPLTHLLRAIYFNPLVLENNNFVPDNAFHKAMHILKLVLKGKVLDYKVYFDPTYSWLLTVTAQVLPTTAMSTLNTYLQVADIPEPFGIQYFQTMVKGIVLVFKLFEDWANIHDIKLKYCGVKYIFNVDQFRDAVQDAYMI